MSSTADDSCIGARVVTGRECGCGLEKGKAGRTPIAGSECRQIEFSATGNGRDRDRGKCTRRRGLSLFLRNDRMDRGDSKKDAEQLPVRGDETLH